MHLVGSCSFSPRPATALYEHKMIRSEAVHGSEDWNPALRAGCSSTRPLGTDTVTQGSSPHKTEAPTIQHFELVSEIQLCKYVRESDMEDVDGLQGWQNVSLWIPVTTVCTTVHFYVPPLRPIKAQDRFDSHKEVAKDGYDAMLPSLSGML